MARKDREAVVLTHEGDGGRAKDFEEEEMGFFERLFAPGTIDTDVSDDEDDETGTLYTDYTGESDGDTYESSHGSTVIRFDKDLRAKHRSACKNMTVGTTHEESLILSTRPMHESLMELRFHFICTDWKICSIDQNFRKHFGCSFGQVRRRARAGWSCFA